MKHCPYFTCLATKKSISCFSEALQLVNILLDLVGGLLISSAFITYLEFYVQKLLKLTQR